MLGLSKNSWFSSLPSGKHWDCVLKHAAMSSFHSHSELPISHRVPAVYMANIPRGSKLPQHRWDSLKSHDVLPHFKNKMFPAEQGATLFTDNPQT
jgi:hypothetical protein